MDKKILRYVGVILLSIGMLGLVLHNINTNDDFFKTSITNVLTLIVAVVLTYYMSQRRNDVRRKKDVVSKILDKICVLISDSRMCEITEKKDVEFILINIRTISNKITCLESLSVQLGYKNELDQIKNIFSEYEDFVSEHISDIDYLKKSRKDLSNKIALIEKKCDTILVNINL